jgi:tetratricopeptide (TPR) repeat protein
VRLSPNGRELFFASWWARIDTGPLVLNTQQKRLYQVLDHPVDQLLWSPDGSKLAVGACREVWIMELDSNVSVTQLLGQEIPRNDLIGRELKRLDEAVAADPQYPENYLRRAVAYMSLAQYRKAESDLQRFEDLVTSDDHHIGYELFWWLRQCHFNRWNEAAELLTPYAERTMERFPGDISSYSELIEEIVEKAERETRTELSRKWRAKLQDSEYKDD